MQSSFQQTFGNHGDYDWSVGSVFGIRWWKLNGQGLLGGVYDSWTAGENVAVCRVDRQTRGHGTPSRSNRAFNAWARGAGPSVISAGPGVPDVLPEDGPEPEPAHTAPDEHCTCGFYAFWKADEEPQVTGTHPVLGVIEGYGRTLIGDRGFRCEKARVVALHIPTDPFGRTNLALLAEVEEALAERYVVPVYATKALMLIRHPPTREYAGD